MKGKRARSNWKRERVRRGRNRIRSQGHWILRRESKKGVGSGSNGGSQMKKYGLALASGPNRASKRIKIENKKMRDREGERGRGRERGDTEIKM